jgi:hypothetical protein
LGDKRGVGKGDLGGDLIGLRSLFELKTMHEACEGVYTPVFGDNKIGIDQMTMGRY